MWISKALLELESGVIKNYILSHSETRLETKIISKQTLTVFAYFLKHDIKIPISGYYVHENFVINPGKSRLYAEWFKQKQKGIPIVIMHTPKYFNLISNQILLDYDNVPDILSEVDFLVIDEDNKLVCVDKTWTQYKDKNGEFNQYTKNWWDKNIAQEWGTVEWQLLGEPCFEIPADNDNKTVINISHALGMYESICELAGLNNFRNLGFYNILTSTNPKFRLTL